MREASQRKSLQGLDNTAAEGAVGFESLEKIVDVLETLGASKTWCCETKKLLNDCKRYLKTDYRVHCQDSHSSCPDHCRDYALSDGKDKAFRVVLFYFTAMIRRKTFYTTGKRVKRVFTTGSRIYFDQYIKKVQSKVFFIT